MKQKIHPYKFSMWIGIASMSMFFGGLTSAYIVRSNQPNWENIPIPNLFFISTITILLSSFTLIKAIQHFKKKEKSPYKTFLLSTLFLGIAFIILQFLAFQELLSNGILINGNVAGSFVYLIVGAHLVHILGGLITLLIVYKKANIHKGNIIGLEITAIYWHFVDILWLYLVIFYGFVK